MPRKQLPEHLRRKPGRPAVYPWDRWFDGKQHHLESVADFDCTAESMRTQIYAVARGRKIKVSVKQVHDGLLVRAYPQEQPLGSNKKYPWDRWLDGEQHSLQVGKDIKAEPESFRIYARSVARSRGLKLTTRTIGNVIIVRAARPAVDPLSDPEPFQ